MQLLKGQWWCGEGEGAFTCIPKNQWCWKLLIRTPNFIKEEELSNAVAALLKRGKSQAVQEARLESFTEGLGVQMLHVGPYEREPEGMMFASDKGKIVAGFRGENARILPEQKRREYRAAQNPPGAGPRQCGQGRGEAWVAAFKGGQLACGDFLLAGPISDAFNLGAVSLRLGGRRLLFDAAGTKVTNVPEANKHWVREYRKGWELTGGQTSKPAEKVSPPPREGRRPAKGRQESGVLRARCPHPARSSRGRQVLPGNCVGEARQETQGSARIPGPANLKSKVSRDGQRLRSAGNSEIRPSAGAGSILPNARACVAHFPKCAVFPPSVRELACRFFDEHMR